MQKRMGNLFIVLGIVGLSWTFGPLISEELRYRLGQEQIMASPSHGYVLTIPSLSIQAPVVEAVNPFNRAEYLGALKQGVAQAKGTALPGETGTQFLFAHSSDAPWRISRYNTAFFRLNRIKLGDEIQIDYQGNRHAYRVSEIKTVWPRDVNYLKDTTQNQLILQTCTPIGTDLKRLLVFAEPIK